jgi:energy-coupling factor transporter ATP-binding protein EcfA2
MDKVSLSLLEIRIPKDNEYTVEQTQTLLSNLSLWQKRFLFFKKAVPISLEIVCLKQKIYFVVALPEDKAQFFQSQLLAQYKDALINPIDDYLGDVDLRNYHACQLTLARSWYLPLKTADQFRDVDPLSSVLATMAKNAKPEDRLLYQLILVPVKKKWQGGLLNLAATGGGKDQNGRFLPHPSKDQIELKASHAGFRTYLRLLTNSRETLDALSGSFGSFAAPKGNYLVAKKPNFLTRLRIIKGILSRSPSGKSQLLNNLEIASLWHLPTGLITLPNIAWGKKISSEPPDNLPIAEGLAREEKKQITFIGKTEFKNRLTTFGIKRPDRARHVYIVGKTGTGKSTLIANMAIEDIRKGEGVAVVDPHGDLIQILLQYIPKNRINDVCYFNPADPEYTYPLNLLEVNNLSQRELVASGIVSIFHKLYAHSWGPRLEHILRNTLLTLTAVPDTTLADVLKILTNSQFRHSVLDRLDDKSLLDFWKREFEPMGERLKQESISPILNKVGQFVSSPLIRQIISNPKSRVKVEEIMNEGKILLVDLSAGKIGEDNSALLGAMIITQIQLAAMNRVFQPEDKRKPFYLFVDEFQNFATRSFIRILSEARKYKLNLTVANQYMAQLDREIQDAILGNVGSLISFLVGAQDAQVLDKEFGNDFGTDDLVSLGKYQILLKLSIDGETSRPFYASTLPLPKCTNKNREKIIRVSRMQFGKMKKS